LVLRNLEGINKRDRWGYSHCDRLNPLITESQVEVKASFKNVLSDKDISYLKVMKHCLCSPITIPANEVTLCLPEYEWPLISMHTIVDGYIPQFII
jgi:hypothetical protein